MSSSEKRYYAPRYSELAGEIELLAIKKKKLLDRIEEKYDRKKKELKKRCADNEHKYDDGVSALENSRFGYNDYRDTCQICGVEIKNKIVKI